MRKSDILLVASAMDIGMQQDIVQNRAPAQQCGFLEHQAGKIGGPGNRIGTDPDRHGTGAGQTGNNLQQRRIDATARTKKREEISRIEIDRKSVGEGKSETESVDTGGGCISTKKKRQNINE